MTNVTTYYLEMLDPRALKPKPPGEGAALVRVDPPMPELNRFSPSCLGTHHLRGSALAIRCLNRVRQAVVNVQGYTV